MNSYDLSRNFWDFSFNNPELIKPNHCAVYFFAIEHCNRLGWKDKFGFPTSMVMEAVGIKSYNTYKSTLDDLVKFGFIKMVQNSKNQYSANIIGISKFDKAQYKALDKALIKHSTKHSTKQSESTVQSIDSIDKQRTTNKQTIEQINKEQCNSELETLFFVFNQYFNTNHSNIEPCKKNYIEWRKKYEPEQIEQSIINASKDQFWKDKLTPVILFRQKNQNKEDVDYIGSLLNRKPEMTPKQEMGEAFKKSLEHQLNKIRNGQ
jgi:hypothetical protein